MRLGGVIADWRWANRMGVREAAKIMGVSSATLCRLEQGRNCDADTLAKIALWLIEPGQMLDRRVQP